ncbi:MAG TPA: hypothetical protein VG944_09395, partial [Fimbriimonas sp.]|nr:hypothetical protein [Fimbriimonas sp.]
LEASLDLGYTGGAGAAGTIKVILCRATVRQMTQLKKIFEEHPGDYQVVLQVMPETEYPPFYPGNHVNPNDSFQRAIRECLTWGDLEIEHHEK